MSAADVHHSHLQPHPHQSQPKHLTATATGTGTSKSLTGTVSGFQSPAAKLKHHSSHFVSPFTTMNNNNNQKLVTSTTTSNSNTNNNNHATHSTTTSTTPYNSSLLNTSASPLFNTNTFKQMSSKNSRTNSVTSSTAATPKYSQSTVNSKHPSVDLTASGSGMHEQENHKNNSNTNVNVNGSLPVSQSSHDKNSMNDSILPTSSRKNDTSLINNNDAVSKSLQPQSQSQRNNIDELLPSMQLSHSQIVSNAVSSINNYASAMEDQQQQNDVDISLLNVAKQITVVVGTVAVLYRVSTYIDRWTKKR